MVQHLRTVRMNHDANFLSFIGYPPVLDAIVALLSKEHNYYRLKRELEAANLNDVEIELIYWVISYILKRERTEKIIPNIVNPLVAGLPQQERRSIHDSVFSSKEQCLRLVSHCLDIPVRVGAIGEPVLDEEYETRLAEWIPEHPFLSEREFRSAIFEAAALATLLASNDEECVQVALTYADSHKHNYHLVYLLHHIAADGQVPIAGLHVILGSAMEFRSPVTSIELRVDGSCDDALHSAVPIVRSRPRSKCWRVIRRKYPRVSYLRRPSTVRVLFASALIFLRHTCHSHAICCSQALRK